MRLELKISEDHFDEFESWFDEHNPPPAKREAVSFSSTGGVNVTYLVRVSVPTQRAAEVLKERWGER